MLLHVSGTKCQCEVWGTAQLCRPNQAEPIKEPSYEDTPAVLLLIELMIARLPVENEEHPQMTGLQAPARDWQPILEYVL
jgi:hypothetical protein